MRILTSWISDPYFHVLAVGLLLAYMAMGAGPDADPKAEEATYCASCSTAHGELIACPAILTPDAGVSLAAH